MNVYSSTHQAVLMESGFEKEKYTSREGVMKWQNSLVEDALEARSTGRLRKSDKRTRPAVDVEHNSVNTDIFWLKKSLDPLLPWEDHIWKKGYCVFDMFLLIFP